MELLDEQPRGKQDYDIWISDGVALGKGKEDWKGSTINGNTNYYNMIGWQLYHSWSKGILKLKHDKPRKTLIYFPFGFLVNSYQKTKISAVKFVCLFSTPQNQFLSEKIFVDWPMRNLFSQQKVNKENLQLIFWSFGI